MLTLVIGNKNYSSWSLRPWLALKMAGVAFEELRVPLYVAGSQDTIRQYSPTGKVPCLIDERPAGRLVVWDSLAICEYVNEQYAQGRLWPTEVVARARARACCAEMHAGFVALRQNLPMDIRSDHSAIGVERQAKAEVAADIARIRVLWLEALQDSGGPFLFGSFSIADAFFAPVVTRFATYGVSLPTELAHYAQNVMQLAPMQDWVAAARVETEVLPV
jgi:glutathione S-transferase